MPVRPEKPFFRVEFTKNPALNVQPVEVLVRQREYSHDVIIMRFTDPDKDRRRAKYRHGQPVTFRWGWAPNHVETFVGYVHSTKVHSTAPDLGGKTRALEVFLVGASYRMNKTRQRSFTKMRTGDIVKRIASENRFSYRGDVSKRVYGTIEKERGGYDAFPQLGRSDFAMCVALAKDVGFTLDVKRTEVRFRVRNIDTRANGKQRSFRLNEAGAMRRGSLLGFTLKAGSAPLANNRRLVMGGIGDDGKPFYAIDPRDRDLQGDMPSFDEYYLDKAPASIHEGRKALSGLSGMSRYYVQADATVSGEANLRSGETVRLTDVGPEVAGYWWVGGVDHELRGQTPGAPLNYICRLQLGRESLQQTVCIDLPQPTSWADKPVVVDPCDVSEVVPETPTVYNPVDECMPLETPATPPPTPRRKYCPGSTKPLPVATRIAPRLDIWAARTPVRRRPAGVR